MGASWDDLKDVYEKQVRSVLEFGVRVWNSSITKQEVVDIEPVQKAFLRIVLDQDYENAMVKLEMVKLEKRRTKIFESIKRSEDPK